MTQKNFSERSMQNFPETKEVARIKLPEHLCTLDERVKAKSIFIVKKKTVNLNFTLSNLFFS